MNDLKLNKDQIFKLINLFKEKECLWNTQSNIYRRVDLKNKAWCDLAAEFNCDVDILKKKIKNLRSTYVAERKKVKNSKKSGSSGEIYEPNLFYYSEMEFLNDSIILRRSTDNLNNSGIVEKDNEEIEFGKEALDADEEQKENCNTSQGILNKKRRHTKAFSSKYEEAIEAIVETVKSPEEDVFTAFAKSVALQLKQLPPIDATETMREIQNIISKRTTVVLTSRLLGRQRNTSVSSAATCSSYSLSSTENDTQSMSSGSRNIVEEAMFGAEILFEDEL